MTRAEMHNALENISDMPDMGIALNCGNIRHMCAEAAGMIRQDHTTICRQRNQLRELRKKVQL